VYVSKGEREQQQKQLEDAADRWLARAERRARSERKQMNFQIGGKGRACGAALQSGPSLNAECFD
jgi:hypothetical protein